MRFRYTERIGLFLMILSLVSPFYIMIIPQPFDEPEVMILGSCWQFIWRDPPHFAVSPFPLLIYLPFWGPGLYIAKIAYDSAKVQDMSRHEYTVKISKIFFIQILLLIFFTLGSGGHPDPIDFPLPIVGIVALLLTKVTIGEPIEPWAE